MSVTLKRQWFALLLAATATMLMPASVAIAQEEADQAAPEAAADEAPADPYAVPDGSAADLVAFIEKLQGQRPKGANRAEMLANFEKMQQAIIAAADKILAGDAMPEQRLIAVRAKLAGLNLLSQLSPQNKNDDLVKFAESLLNDSDPQIAAEAQQIILSSKAASIGQLDDEAAAKLLEELLAHIRGAGELGRQHLQLAFTAGQSLERAGKTDLAAKAYQAFSELFVGSSDANLASYGKKMAGSARRVGLVGNPMEISGTLPDGSTFDWAQYKGKVVLVDFWATWCGPCRAELPNVKEQYAKYHDKGFEVVGISLDEDKDKLEQFVKENELPWVTLFSNDPAATGWDHPMATHYGIMAIPATILIDRDGNVVTMAARGEALGAELDKLLGPGDAPAGEGDKTE